MVSGKVRLGLDIDLVRAGQERLEKVVLANALEKEGS